MKGAPRQPLRFVRRLRAVLAVGLAAVVILILAYFLTHLRRPPSAAERKGDFTPQKIQVQENGRYTEFNRGQSSRQTSAPKSYLGSDGLWHYEGGVKITDRGRKGGREILISADQGVMDADQTMGRLTGHVTATSKGLTIYADAMAYDKAEELVTSKTGVTLRSERFEGLSRTFSYSLKDETVIMEGDVDLSIKVQVGGPEPLKVRAGRMIFNDPARLARLEGPVHLEHGRTTGSADVVEFKLFADKDEIQTFWMMGRARVSLRESKPPAPGKKPRRPAKPAEPASNFRPLFSLQSEDQDISADQLLLDAYIDSRSVSNVRAKGQVSFLLMAADGGRTRVEGESLFFLFDKDKTLNVMNIQRGAHLTGSDPGDPVERRLEGERISYDGFTRALKSFGSPAGPSRSRSADEEVAADWIFVFTQNNNVNASGSVTVVLRPKPAGEAGIEGFFQAGRPVFVRAGLLTREDVAQQFSLYQGFRMWQDKQVLEGRYLELDERTQEMDVHEGVRMSFVQAPKAGDPEERVEVAGDYMRYDPASLQTVFTGKGGLKVRDIDLRAPILIVVPEPETGKARKILSTGGVYIKWGLREATCENSDYDISQGSITLTGNPVVTEKDKSTIRGDKLTIHLADGNIQVENRDQQRSDVIIKS